MLRTILAIASREPAVDCVNVVFCVSVDEIWDVVDGAHVGAGCAMDRFTIFVEVLVGEFDCFGAAQILYFVVDGSSDVCWKLA